MHQVLDGASGAFGGDPQEGGDGVQDIRPQVTAPVVEVALQVGLQATVDERWVGQCVVQAAVIDFAVEGVLG